MSSNHPLDALFVSNVLIVGTISLADTQLGRDDHFYFSLILSQCSNAKIRYFLIKVFSAGVRLEFLS